MHVILKTKGKSKIEIDKIVDEYVTHNTNNRIIIFVK